MGNLHGAISTLGAPLSIFQSCGGIYECPRDDEGKRIGPLTGYVGMYDDGSGARKSYVGDVYYNFRMAAQWPHVITCFASRLQHELASKGFYHEITATIAAPGGSACLSQALGRMLEVRTLSVEKHVVKLATTTDRERSNIVLYDGMVERDDRVIVGEDICNNFTTTGRIVKLVRAAGAHVCAIACFLNRSNRKEFEGLPVVSLEHIPTVQYRQDDPEVAEDIRRGNVVWKPTPVWMKLLSVMRGEEVYGPA